MTGYQLDHGGFCRVAIATSKNPNKRRGAELVRWFFHHQGRHRTAWSSVDMARQINTPVAICNAALREARDAGLVKLAASGKRWIWAESED